MLAAIGAWLYEIADGGDGSPYGQLLAIGGIAYIVGDRRSCAGGADGRRLRGMEQRVSLITLGVRDLARARAFYEALGWVTRAKPDDDVVFFQAGGLVFALWDRGLLAEDSGVEDGGGWGGVTLAHNVRSPDEVDAVIEEARRAGADIVREPAETFWGGYSAAFTDPEGHPGRSPTTRAGRSRGRLGRAAAGLASGALSSITGIVRGARLRYCTQPG